MKIKLGDLVRSNHNSHFCDVGIVTNIKKEKRAPTMIKVYWQKSKRVLLGYVPVISRG
jgi:hypothetical protein